MHPVSRSIAHGLVGRNLKVADVDGTYATLLGRTRGAVVGHDLLAFIHADDRDAAALLLRRAWDDGEAASATLRHLYADGGALWVDVHASRLGRDGEERLVVTCRPLPSRSQQASVEAQWQMARLLIQAIEGGKRAFGEALIGNPATEILLLAYLAEAEARSADAGDLARRMNVSWPLTQRWLLAMTDAGFVEAERAGPISRETPIRLTPRALAMIEAIFGALVAIVRGSPVPA